MRAAIGARLAMLAGVFGLNVPAGLFRRNDANPPQLREPNPPKIGRTYGRRIFGGREFEQDIIDKATAKRERKLVVSLLNHSRSEGGKKRALIRLLRGLCLFLFFAVPGFAQVNITIPVYNIQPAVIVPLDKQGKPGAKIDGALSWSTTNTNAITITNCTANNLTCQLNALAEGTAIVTVTGDGALGTPYRPLTWVWNITVLPPEAYSLDGILGEPIAGNVITGTVTITASAADESGVEKIEIGVDAVALDTIHNPSGSEEMTGSVLWDTTTAAAGKHVVYAEATDINGNAGKVEREVIVGAHN